jgi:hypothetical protein
MQERNTIQQVLTATTVSAAGDGEGYRLAPDVLLLKVWDGSSRLIDLSGDSFGLPAISTTLLELTLRHGPDRAADEVARQYEVPCQRVRADFEPLLRDLGRRRLLTRRGRAGRWQGLLRGMSTRPVAYALRFSLRSIPSDTGKARVLLSLAFICLKLFGWARTVELWRDVSVDEPVQQGRGADPSRLERIEHTVREALSRSIFPVDCKARALSCWAMLHSAGLPARLVVGIDLFPFLGHCWCESGARILVDRIDRCSRFTPVLQYS